MSIANKKEDKMTEIPITVVTKSSTETKNIGLDKKIEEARKMYLSSINPELLRRTK